MLKMPTLAVPFPYPHQIWSSVVDSYDEITFSPQMLNRHASQLVDSRTIVYQHCLPFPLSCSPFWTRRILLYHYYRSASEVVVVLHWDLFLSILFAMFQLLWYRHVQMVVRLQLYFLLSLLWCYCYFMLFTLYLPWFQLFYQVTALHSFYLRFCHWPSLDLISSCLQ